MEYIELAIGIYLFAIALWMNTENFRSYVLFKAFPFVISIFLTLDGLMRAGFVIVL